MPASTRRKLRQRSSPALPINVTHPGRVIYRDQGITKQRVVEYYAAVASYMLPHLADRPISMFRCPGGIDEACFFQKHPPAGIPKSLRRVTIHEKNVSNQYLVVDDLEGLLSLVQFGTLEFHGWGARVDQIERPDRLVFDLDPAADVDWTHVVEGAQALHELLAEFDLKSFVKTTGGKSLHVVVPIARKSSWSLVKDFSRAVAELISRMAPTRYLAEMSKAKRPGKVFVDYLRNERGATWVAPFSLRARAAAPVSMPVEWRQLSKLSTAAAFILEDAVKHLSQRRTDPWRGFFQVRQSLTSSMLRSLQRL
jgi:bifunctional non-homologous end joining protein LigD